MAAPKNIGYISYTLKDLEVMYEYTPDFYSRFISALDPGNIAKDVLRKTLTDDWKFEIEAETFDKISLLLGCASAG